MSRAQFVERMRQRCEELFGQVADAINAAPTGQVIAASEEKVRDLFGQLRQEAYALGLQMRIDAAEAAFPPSDRPDQPASQEEYGATGLHRPDRQRPRAAVAPALALGR